MTEEWIIDEEWAINEEPLVLPGRLDMDGLAGLVAENIRYEAARYELSQEDLARAVGKSRASISMRATGRVPWTLHEVGLVATLMGITPAVLVTRPDRPTSSEW